MTGALVGLAYGLVGALVVRRLTRGYRRCHPIGRALLFCVWPLAVLVELVLAMGWRRSDP